MSDYEIRKIVQNRLVECRIEANLTQKEDHICVKKCGRAKKKEPLNE